jgi:hypothetical protein
VNLVKHTWATPDPDEYDPNDAEDRATKYLCTRENPWWNRDGVEHVFHPESIIEGVDYICTACGERTYRESAS